MLYNSERGRSGPPVPHPAVLEIVDVLAGQGLVFPTSAIRTSTESVHINPQGGIFFRQFLDSGPGFGSILDASLLAEPDGRVVHVGVSRDVLVQGTAGELRVDSLDVRSGLVFHKSAKNGVWQAGVAHCALHYYYLTNEQVASVSARVNPEIRIVESWIGSRRWSNKVSYPVARPARNLRDSRVAADLQILDLTPGLLNFGPRRALFVVRQAFRRDSGADQYWREGKPLPEVLRFLHLGN